MQIVSIGDNLQEMPKPVSWENKEIFQYDVCWKLYLACYGLMKSKCQEIASIPHLAYSDDYYLQNIWHEKPMQKAQKKTKQEMCPPDKLKCKLLMSENFNTNC